MSRGAASGVVGEGLTWRCLPVSSQAGERLTLSQDSSSASAKREDLRGSILIEALDLLRKSGWGTNLSLRAISIKFGMSVDVTEDDTIDLDLR